MPRLHDSFSVHMMSHLKPLAQRFLENGDYSYLSTVSDLMSGLSNGKWSNISADDKEYFLEKMSADFHPRGMGDSIYGSDDHYRAILDIISNEKMGLRAKK